MAWVVPITFVANSTLASDALSQMLYNCMNETMPAKATEPGSYFVSTGVNQIAERKPAQATVFTSETRTTASFGDLATVGPSVTVNTGTKAIIVITCQLSNNTVSQYARVSYQVSGATSISPSFVHALAWQNAGTTQQMACSYVTYQNLNTGFNTFTMKYYASGGTATFQRRRILVLPF